MDDSHSSVVVVVVVVVLLAVPVVGGEELDFFGDDLTDFVQIWTIDADKQSSRIFFINLTLRSNVKIKGQIFHFAINTERLNLFR